ncbi:MAG TPA: ATP-binding protein [Polyangiaceae bacterium]|nr:ATP-binding protein [Polyangiaceae bacterium]
MRARRRPLLSAEGLALTWEALSASLFAAAVAPAVARSAAPGLLFAAGLALTALLRPRRWAAASRGGAIGLLALRAGGWVASCWPLVDAHGLTLVSLAGLFGAMAAPVRLALYDLASMRAWERAPAPALARGLAPRIATSATAAGVVAGHVLMLFTVAFLRMTSAQLRLAWLTSLPWLALVPTGLYAAAVRALLPPVRAGLLGAGDARVALARALAVPTTLAWLNVAFWTGAGVAGALALRARLGFDVPTLVTGATATTFFAWGLTLHQRAWHRALLGPVVARLRAVAPAPAPAARVSLRRRLLVDFGLPLSFFATLFLSAALGLYVTLQRERGGDLALADVLALVASCAAVTGATGALVLRTARELSGPIVGLAAAAERVAGGELGAGVPPPPDAPREVSELGAAVEAMRVTLGRAIDELEAERAGLEARVIERTAELSRALDELRNAQAALLHGEKMASLGQLVAGVAHEMNNPLNAIAGSVAPVPALVDAIERLLGAYERRAEALPGGARAELAGLRRELDVDEALADLRAIGELVARASARGARIVDGLRRFSRPASEEGPARLDEGLDETLALLGPALREAGVEVERDYGPLPPVVCRGGEINQVLMNLLANALAAVSGRPTRRVRVQTRCDGEWVEVCVDDSGPGVEPALRSRVFDPFFTTKPAGQGTGLGLSISLQIVKRHGGDLRVEDGPLGGARFAMTLPRVPPARPSVAPGGLCNEAAHSRGGPWALRFSRPCTREP